MPKWQNFATPGHTGVVAHLVKSKLISPLIDPGSNPVIEDFIKHLSNDNWIETTKGWKIKIVQV